MRKIIIVLGILLVAGFTASASPGYKITIKIDGMEDTVLYLAHYFGDKTYLADTAYHSKKGHFVFQGEKSLDGGIYIVAGQNNNKLFEMMIDKEQSFSASASAPDIFGSLQFRNSIENELFYKYIRANVASQKELERLGTILKTLPIGSDSLELIQKEIDTTRINAEGFREQMIQQGEGTFLSVMLRAMIEPDPLKLLVNEKEKQDSLVLYKIYKRHFWDQFDVSDDRLLRTPLYHKRLEHYFNRVVYQQTDSIIAAIETFIPLVEPNPETFKYVVWYLTYKFETSMIMGFDEIFVHMVDSYYSADKAFWADSTVVRSLQKRADALRNVLIGATAPNLIIIDTTGSFVSLHHQPAPYLFVFFYEMGCGHCKKELDELKAWMEKDDIGVQVFAVNTDTSLVQWKNYINENKLPFIHANATRSITPRYHDLYDISSTPTIFLLDENKKIIAKRLKVSQMVSYLQHYHQRRYDEPGNSY
ncbi:MAG: redoxin domain-containing protein [Bacteroidales bacterium]